MTKVQVHSAPQAPKGKPAEVALPSESIIRTANEVAVVIDASGRQIGIKRLGPVARLHMLKLIGGNNEHYMGMASLAFLVESIDGAPVAKPINDLQLDGLIARLGDEGIDAVALGAVEHFGAGETLSKAELKNS